MNERKDLKKYNYNFIKKKFIEEVKIMPVYWGMWEEDAPSDSKVTAIHACLLHNGNVLFFHCRSFPFWTRIYDPVSNTVLNYNLEVPKWPKYYEETETESAYPIQPSRIFCCGHGFMADGRLLVVGGELSNPYPNSYEPIALDRGLRYSFIFDPENETWKITGTFGNPFIMKKGRWYPTITILHNGKMLAMAGKEDTVLEIINGFTVLLNRIPEIYDENSNPPGWTSYDDPTAIMPLDVHYYYPDAHVIPLGDLEGKVFYASTQLVPDNNDPPEYTEAGHSQIFDPFTETDFWTPIDSRRSSPSEFSSGLMLPIRKSPNAKARFLITGGWWINFLKRIDIIDLTGGLNSDPVWSSIDDMSVARQNHHAVILPDRNLLIVGGENENGEVLSLELLDTDKLEWIDVEIPPMPVGRRYHSIGILLPNAKVLMGGGRVPNGGDVEDDTERRFSIFKPKYLMDGAQPLIIYDTQIEITYGNTFEITLDEYYLLDSIALLKPGSVTHSNNMDQRYIELDFISKGETGVYEVTAPANSYLAPPGYYMLFVLKDKTLSISGESKIPSNAVFVKLS